MKNFLSAIKTYICSHKRVNYRDRRAHYASSALKCLRDQSWELQGEPHTDKTDFLGYMKMLVGDAVEKLLVNEVFTKLHRQGYHLAGGQVATGTSNPNIDGFLDALMERQTEKGWERFVVEIKTKHGRGANILMQNYEPSKEYMSQLGLYLKDLHEKGITNEGVLFYVILSDKHFGEILQLDCRYDEETGDLVVYRGQTSSNNTKKLNLRYHVNDSIERFLVLEKYMAEGKVPPPDYQYKYPITQEIVANWTDSKIKSILSGSSIGGDWQPLYSPYKTKQLEADGISPERSKDELNILLMEWRRRHPKSKFTQVEDFKKPKWR